MGHAFSKFRFVTKFAIPRRFYRQEHVPISADFAHVSKISSREEISCRQENFLLGRKKPRTRPGETNQEPAVTCATDLSIKMRQSEVL